MKQGVGLPWLFLFVILCFCFVVNFVVKEGALITFLSNLYVSSLFLAMRTLSLS